MQPPQTASSAVVSLKDRERRLVSWPNVRQEGAYEIPRVLTLAQQDKLRESLQSEMDVLGFSERQFLEANQALESYGSLSREWYAQHRTLSDDEMSSGGYQRKVFDFVEECRDAGILIKAPENPGRAKLDQLRIATLTKSEKLTEKMTGGATLLMVAMAIKTYLLSPLAASLLVPLLGPGAGVVKTALAIPLALALSFGITFMMRFLVMQLIGLFPGERFKNHRHPGQLFGRKLTIAIAALTAIVLAGTLYAFMQVDLAEFSRPGRSDMISPMYAVGGLSSLFLGIVLCFEIFWTYRILRKQDEPELVGKEKVKEAYLAAVDRYEDDLAVSRLRTLALDAQATFYDFTHALDRINPNKRSAAHFRKRSMAQLRRKLRTPSKFSW